MSAGNKSILLVWNISKKEMSRIIEVNETVYKKFQTLYAVSFCLPQTVATFICLPFTEAKSLDPIK